MPADKCDVDVRKCDVHGCVVKDDEVMMNPSVAVSWETRSSTAYHWDNARRGKGPYVVIQYTHSGCGWFRWRGRDHEVAEGQAFVALVPEGSSYGFPAGAREPWSFAWIDIDGALAVRLWKALRDAHGPVLRLGHGSLAEAGLLELVSWVEGRRHNSRFEAAAEAYEFYLAILRHVSGGAGSDTDPLESARRRICEGFHEPFNIKALAAGLGWSREHFTREYARRFGRSPAAELRSARLEAAAALLQRTGLPVHEVARRCGFVTSRQFSKTFHQFRGRTPGSARHSAANE